MERTMTNKTIYYVGNFDRPESNAAGKRVYGNALILSKLGYKVVLIGKSKNETGDTPVNYGDNIVFLKFPNYAIYKSGKYLNFVCDTITKLGKPEFIIRYGSPGLAEFDRQLLTFCKRIGIKLIADVVDWLSPSGDSFIFNSIKRIDTYLEKGVFNAKSDGVIAISSYLSHYYTEKNCNTVIIPPLVAEYKENNSYNVNINLVYAGVPFRLNRKIKNNDEVKDRLDLAVHGIAGVIKRGLAIVFDIYGITKEQYLMAYPNDSDFISNAIRFHGKQSMQIVQEHINKADFTILLRDRNRASMAGFPTKIVESVSCGTPVITTDTSDITRYITNNKTGFIIDVSNEKNMINEFERILCVDREQLQSMKRNCFESKDFSPENYQSAMQDFLESVL